MKTSSRSLFHLIHALSKEEKNYILRTAIHYRKGGKNILVQLFKAMEQLKTEEYDEKELAKKIPNLPVRKNELFETILRSLADREETNLAVLMLGKLRWAAMLHYRKLFPEALSILTEIEEWAKAENQPYILGVILQYKTFFVNSGLYKNHNINFADIGEHMVANAQNILHITEVYRQYVEVIKIVRMTFLLRSEEECEKVRLLSRSPVYQKDVRFLPISSQVFFHFSRYYVYKFTCEYEKAYAAAEQAWELMKDKEVDFPRRRPQEYLAASISYLAACLDGKKWDELKKGLPVFEKWLTEKYNGNLIPTGKYYCLYLAHHCVEDGADISLSVVREVQNFFVQHQNVVDDEVRRGLQYMLMIAFFQRGDFSMAWNYCQIILNSSSTAPRRELYDVARVVFMLILFESNKSDELELHCKQLSGFIKKKEKKEYLLERTLVKHFKKIATDTYSKADRLVILRKLNNDLHQLSKSDNVCVKQLLHQFDFIGWTQRKIDEFSKSEGR